MARNFIDATNTYLTYAGAILSSHPLTVSAWIRVTRLDNTSTFFGMGHITGDAWISITMSGTIAGDPFRVRMSDDSSNPQTIYTTTGITFNAWHHCCFVWVAANDARIFIDGGSKGVGTTTLGTFTFDGTDIGSRYVGGAHGEQATGDIAEVVMWNTAFSDNEVALLAKGISPLSIHPQNLVAYWPLFGTQSPEPDVVGGYDMTLVNAPTEADHPPVIHTVGSRGINYQEPATGKTLLTFDPRTGKPEAV